MKALIIRNPHRDLRRYGAFCVELRGDNGRLWAQFPCLDNDEARAMRAVVERHQDDMIGLECSAAFMAILDHRRQRTHGAVS